MAGITLNFPETIMKGNGNIRIAWLIALLAGMVLFIPFLGGVHLFDWDEINFAESAREMIATGDYLTVRINYLPFWEKPPLFIWMQVLSMKVFGINEFAARFPDALCGIFTLITLFYSGRKLFGDKFAFLWMLAYAGSILPFFYFKSGIIDPWFNLFIFLGIIHLCYYFMNEEHRLRNTALSAFFTGLAILTKGPVALLIVFIVSVVYLIYRRFRVRTGFRDILIFVLILSLTGGFWFILQILNGNAAIIRDFLLYQVRLFSTHDAGHRGFLLYHFVILLAGVFPASALALPAMFRNTGKNENMQVFGFWMKALFWTVLILFTIVQTKIIHYSSLCYFPLTFFAALYMERIYDGRVKWDVWTRYVLLLLTIVYSVAVLVLTFTGKYSREIISRGWIKDPFAEANLRADVHWNGFEFLPGLIFLAGMIFFMFFLKKPKVSITGIFAVTIFFTYFNVVFITPKIEGYSQRAAVEFYTSLRDREVYVATLGFKSYAQLFYARIKPYEDPRGADTGWLLTGDIDRPAFFVFKIQRMKKYTQDFPQLEILYEKNGFVFAKRKENKKE